MLSRVFMKVEGEKAWMWINLLHEEDRPLSLSLVFQVSIRLISCNPEFHLLDKKRGKPCCGSQPLPTFPLVSRCVGSHNRICERTRSQGSLRCVFFTVT